MHSREKYHWLPHVPLAKILADKVLKATYCLFIEFSIILLCKIWHSIGPYPKFSLWLQVQNLKPRISNSDVKFFLSLKWWVFLRMLTYILTYLVNTWSCGFKDLPNWMPEKHSWIFLLQSNKTSVFSYENFILRLPSGLNWNTTGLHF